MVATLTLNQPASLLNNTTRTTTDNIVWAKTYTKNTIGEVVEFQNLEGNLTGSAEVNITRIDKTPPLVIAEDEEKSSEKIVIVITIDKPVQVTTPGRTLKPS
ncbi:hypothetical protein FACS1894176_07140 [Bacteroidia bacterium]|nr:hypothetical protein FACS189428_1650 [Clostridia bacterium]GHV26424.1 hypothetical protein FACS1894176_07140 [Bacteroidia bacterium]